MAIRRVCLVLSSPGQQKAVNFIENIYKKHLIPLLTQVNPNHQLMLMEDNAPKHNTCASKAFLAKKWIQKIKGQAQLPNLNPIENIWFILKCNIQQLY